MHSVPQKGSLHALIVSKTRNIIILYCHILYMCRGQYLCGGTISVCTHLLLSLMFVTRLHQIKFVSHSIRSECVLCNGKFTGLTGQWIWQIMQMRAGDKQKTCLTFAASFEVELLFSLPFLHHPPSATTNALHLPKVSSNHGQKAFSFCGPKAWITLPPATRQSTSLHAFLNSAHSYLFT